MNPEYMLDDDWPGPPVVDDSPPPPKPFHEVLLDGLLVERAERRKLFEEYRKRKEQSGE